MFWLKACVKQKQGKSEFSSRSRVDTAAVAIFHLFNERKKMVDLRIYRSYNSGHFEYWKITSSSAYSFFEFILFLKMIFFKIVGCVLALSRFLYNEESVQVWLCLID